MAHMIKLVCMGTAFGMGIGMGIFSSNWDFVIPAFLILIALVTEVLSPLLDKY